MKKHLEHKFRNTVYRVIHVKSYCRIRGGGGLDGRVTAPNNDYQTKMSLFPAVCPPNDAGGLCMALRACQRPFVLSVKFQAKIRPDLYFKFYYALG